MNKKTKHQLDRIEEMLKRLAVQDQAKKFASDFANALINDQLIEAIGAYRALTGLGLKEAKDIVAAIRRNAWRNKEAA